MKTEKTHIGWAKWLIGIVIAIIGAAGGIVAILKYVDDKTQIAEQKYINAIEEWKEFSPTSVSLRPQQIDIKAGECIDLNLGRIVNQIDGKRDLCFNWWRDNEMYALSTQDNIEVAELGIVNFPEIRYQTLKEAPFVLAKKYKNSLPILFRSNRSERPNTGFVYVLKLPTHHIAKVQIVEYIMKPLENAPSIQWPYVRIRYETFPIVAIPRKPKRSDFK